MHPFVRISICMWNIERENLWKQDRTVIWGGHKWPLKQPIGGRSYKTYSILQHSYMRDAHLFTLSRINTHAHARLSAIERSYLSQRIGEGGWPYLRGGVTFAWTIGDSSAAWATIVYASSWSASTWSLSTFCLALSTWLMKLTRVIACALV